MRNVFKPDERLKMLSSMVRHSSRLLDVGTDHAYLPVYLVGEGVCPSAVAADIGEGPLDNARETVERYGMSDKITLCLSDGFDDIPADCADDIVIAGMGGNLIAEIIERGGWIKNHGIRLVLQPMTHVEDVRRCLCANGFQILSENTCICENRVYIALSAEYDGERRCMDETYYYTGELPSTKYDRHAAFLYMDKHMKRIQQRIDALKVVEPYGDEHRKLIDVLAGVKDVMAQLAQNN